ncbi:MAG TPA: lasso peptide biosynthesis protein [Spirillospora sp.]
MLLSIKAMTAAREAREFLSKAKADDGSYRLEEWPEVRRGNRAGRRREVRRTRAAVARLRIALRLTAGFLDPVDDSVFLTAGLRRLGIPASFHLGRELAPARPPAGYFAWVQHGDDVVSTSLPVKDEYIEIHRSVA